MAVLGDRYPAILKISVETTDLYSLPSERIDVAALRAATLFLGFICLFLRWEGSSYKTRSREAMLFTASLFFWN